MRIFIWDRQLVALHVFFFASITIGRLGLLKTILQHKATGYADVDKIVWNMTTVWKSET